MEIYVAAPHAARDHLKDLFETWRENEPDNGWLGVTSGWFDEEELLVPGAAANAQPELSDEQVREYSLRDFHDIERAHALLLFTGPWVMNRWGLVKDQTTSGGRHIETGWALAHAMPVVVVGEPENIFHRGVCTVVPDFEYAIQHLKEI